MFFYTILLFLIICSSAIVTYGKNPQIVACFKVFTFLLFFIPAALRYDVGTDYQNYIDLFYEINAGRRLATEPGYRFLNLFVYRCGGSAQLVLAISAFITLFFFFHGVEKERWLVYSVVFLIICWPWYCSTVRQMIACSFAFYAWRKNNTGHHSAAILYIGLACLFHYSAFVYPLVYLFCNKVYLSKPIQAGIYIVCIVCCFNGMLGNIIRGAVANVYRFGDLYEHSVWLQSTEITGSGLGRILRLILYLLILLFLPNNTSLDKTVQTMFFLYIITDALSIEVAIILRLGRGIIFIILVAIYQAINARQYFRPIARISILGILIIWYFAALVRGFAYCAPYMTVFNY